jgi:hypothetical protein
MISVMSLALVVVELQNMQVFVAAIKLEASQVRMHLLGTRLTSIMWHMRWGISSLVAIVFTIVVTAIKCLVQPWSDHHGLCRYMSA